MLDTRATRTIAAMRAAGLAVSFRQMHHGGWPFAATLTFDAPRIAGPIGGIAPSGSGLSGQIAWGAGHLRLRITAVHPAMLVIHAGPRQALTYTPDDRDGLASSPLPGFRIQSGRSLLRLRDADTSEATGAFAIDRLAIGWASAGQPVTVTLWGPAGTFLLRPHAAPDTTIMAMDTHAAVLSTDVVPGWLRPWPWTTPAAQIALIAPRTETHTLRLLVQSITADVGGAHARFAGAVGFAPGTASRARTAEGDGTLVIDGAYAVLDRWLDWAVRHPNDATVPIHVAPATLAAIRRLLPEVHAGSDRISLPIAVRQGIFEVPGSPWVHDVAHHFADLPQTIAPNGN